VRPDLGADVIHSEDDGTDGTDPTPPSTTPDAPDAPGAPDDENEPTAEPVVEERRYPSTVGGACYLVVLGVGVAAIVVAGVDDWRFGVRLLAGALGGAAACRLVLPQRDAGMLAVRHRLVDVALLVAVAVTLWVLAGDIPDQPGPVVVPG